MAGMIHGISMARLASVSMFAELWQNPKLHRLLDTYALIAYNADYPTSQQLSTE